MQSGKLDASSIAYLAAALNVGVDAGALAGEAPRSGGAIPARVQLEAASFESHETVERMAVDLFYRHEFDADVARHTRGAELEAFKRREARARRSTRAGCPNGCRSADSTMFVSRTARITGRKAADVDAVPGRRRRFRRQFRAW
jgi:hypothetical protein